jgi:CubicO group peptidase (beta-lactamase class C family)
MGAEANASWLVDKGGYEAAFTGVNATLRDYGRLGLMLATDGKLGGRQVVPADWVRAATTPAGKAFEPGRSGSLLGYGYQTWILPSDERQFVFRGVRRQALFVDPASKTVMVHTGVAGIGDPNFSELLALWRGVLASLK